MIHSRQSLFYTPTCACGLDGARHTTGAVRINSEQQGDRTVFRVNLYVGPSCDVCGKPWTCAGRPNRPVVLR